MQLDYSRTGEGGKEQEEKLREVEKILLKDERTPWLHVHSAYDEMPLTLEAFRVLAHLSRKAANDNGKAFPSYATIGETCFRGSYPNSSSDTLRRKAMKAVKELVGYGLIRKETIYRKNSSETLGNTYVLAHTSEWKLQPQESESQRKCQGTRDGGAGGAPGEGGGAGGAPGGAPQASGGAGGAPKVNPGEVNPGEVNPKIRRDRGTGQAQGSEPVHPVEEETTSLPSEKDETGTTADQPVSESDSSAAAPPPKKAAPKAAAIYARIKDLPRFERFWAWYSKDFCSVTSHNGGSKSEAGAAWLHLEQTDYLGVGVEGFNQGVKIQIKKRPLDGVGIQHACRFLSGGGKGEPDWLVDYQESIASEHVSPKAFLSDLAGTDPHTPDDLEARKARRQAEILAQARAEADRMLGVA
jgi:hypothetical protein